MTGDDRDATSNDVFTAEEKRAIAGQAWTLLERLEAPASLTRREQPESGDMKLFEAWRDAFPDEEAFSRRLDRLGTDRESCRRAICAEGIVADEPLPHWLDCLEEIVIAIHECSPDEPTAMLEANWNLGTDGRIDGRPFGELTAAIAAHTLSRLSTDIVDDSLAEPAVESVFQWLRNSFEERFWRILLVEFKGNVKTADSALAAADVEEFDSLPRTYYDGFIDFLFSGGFGDLCREHPMFSRLLATEVGCRERQLREFLTRLRADRTKLVERFGADAPLGEAVDVEPLADAAYGASRPVVRVTFESGFTVVYKHRSVVSGVTFFRALDRLDARLPTPDLETPAYISTGDYGWMEWIEHQGCEDEQAVERYYRRAGALACVAYFLGLVDCTVDNLVAAGDQPVLVDVEAVLQPHLEYRPRPDGVRDGGTMPDDVLETGLLPKSGIEAEDGIELGRLGATVAGFGHSSETATLESITEPTVKGINSDVMTVERQPVSVDRTENVPTLDGVDQPPDAYSEQILDGFESAYETILTLRDDGRLYDEIELFDSFESVETRFVYRSWYSRFLRTLTTPESLHDGIGFGIALERLVLPFCNMESSHTLLWRMYDAERAALKRLEKPRFTCRADGRKISLDGSPVGAETERSGLELCRDRIQSATREDMNAQMERIGNALDVLAE